MRCPYCARKLSFWRLQCRACRRNIWRLPHIFFFGGIGLAAFLALILVIDFLATRR